LKNNLAIIIPAYKPDYLEQALFSLENQSNKSFNVYIGDDNSPHDLYQIIKPFETTLSITYKKFDTNLGSTSLTKQWERCIEMAQKEDWIWLFSDDDLAGENCIEVFHHTLRSTNSQYDIYKFPTTIIDNQGETIRIKKSKDSVIDSLTFIERIISFRLDGFACEYIFKKKTYEETGKFVEFPLAWCSDMATWARIGKSKGIYQIVGESVKWRYSGLNLSSNLSANYLKKEEAILLFIDWLKTNFVSKASFNKLLINFFIENARHNEKIKNWTELQNLLTKLNPLFPTYKLYICMSLLMCSYRLHRKILKSRINVSLQKLL